MAIFVLPNWNSTFLVLGEPYENIHSLAIPILPLEGKFYEPRTGKTYTADELRGLKVYLSVRKDVSTKVLGALAVGNMVVVSRNGFVVYDRVKASEQWLVSTRSEQGVSESKGVSGHKVSSEQGLVSRGEWLKYVLALIDGEKERHKDKRVMFEDGVEREVVFVSATESSEYKAVSETMGARGVQYTAIEPTGGEFNKVADGRKVTAEELRGKYVVLVSMPPPRPSEQ